MPSRVINRTPNQTCDHCGEGFYLDPHKLLNRKSDNFFCSLEHRSLFIHRPNTECAVCKVPLWRRPYEIKHRQGIFFCSREHQSFGLSLQSNVPLNAGPSARNPEERLATYERKNGLIDTCKYCPSVRAVSKLINGCCNRCIYIDRWLQGKETGTSPKTNEISDIVIRYIKSLKGDQCWECGWCEINPVTGKVPVQIDHIDGNSANNHLSNLRLLCPNHHSLTPTFGNAGYRAGKSARTRRYVPKMLDKAADT